MTARKIMILWVKKGLVPGEPATKDHSPLYKTALKFAKAISEMDGSDSEKWHFANTITKIFE